MNPFIWEESKAGMNRERVISAFSRFSEQELVNMHSVARAGCGDSYISREGRLQRLGNYYGSRISEIKAFLDKWATDPMDIDQEWEGIPPPLPVSYMLSLPPLLQPQSTFNLF